MVCTGPRGTVINKEQGAKNRDHSNEEEGEEVDVSSLTSQEKPTQEDNYVREWQRFARMLDAVFFTSFFVAEAVLFFVYVI